MVATVYYGYIIVVFVRYSLCVTFCFCADTIWFIILLLIIKGLIAFQKNLLTCHLEVSLYENMANLVNVLDA